jgi:hypothetical protein
LLVTVLVSTPSRKESFFLKAHQIGDHYDIYI